MTKALVLLRVSSDGQTRRAGSEEGYSIELQRRACYEKADALGAEVVEEFRAPAESASKGLYKSLRAILDTIRARQDIAYLIVYRLGRLARDELTHFTALAELRACGCQLVSVSENVDETPKGMLLNGILASINAYYSRDLGQKILEGNIQKARSGGTPVRAPLGYLNVRRWDGANDIRSIAVDPERAPLIQYAFAAYATGEVTLNELVETLARRGLRTRPSGKRPAAKVACSTLARLLQNPYYVGTVRYRGVDYDGAHPPLIDRQTFVRVQEVLRARHRAGEKHWRHTNPLKGSLYCEHCGALLRFTEVRNRHGERYRYFVCGTRHSGGRCALPYLKEDAVEQAVARHYASRVRFDAKRLDALEADLARAFEAITAERERELDADRRAAERLRSERRRLLDAHLAGAVPLDLFAAKQAELTAELQSAETRLAAAAAGAEQAKAGLRETVKLLRKAGRTYADADAITRRAWNQAFFTRLFVGMPPSERSPDVARAERNTPFAELLADGLPAAARAVASGETDPPAFAGGSFEREANCGPPGTRTRNQRFKRALRYRLRQRPLDRD